MPMIWLVGFLTSSSTTRLYRGRAPRQSVWQFYVLPHRRQSWETMTSVSAGHIILTPTQPVGSGRPLRGNRTRDLLTRSRALYPWATAPPPPPSNDPNSCAVYSQISKLVWYIVIYLVSSEHLKEFSRLLIMLTFHRTKNCQTLLDSSLFFFSVTPILHNFLKYSWKYALSSTVIYSKWEKKKQIEHLLIWFSNNYWKTYMAKDVYEPSSKSYFCNILRSFRQNLFGPLAPETTNSKDWPPFLFSYFVK